MGTPTNEEIVRTYALAHEKDEGDVMGALRHPEWVAEMPQSGELIRGHVNDRAIAENWPGGRPAGTVHRIVGAEDRWVTTPAWTVQRVSGSGDMWWIETDARYPNGEVWSAVILVELLNGMVVRERWHFGQPFEAPAWRAQWVERLDEQESSDRR